MRRGIKLRCLHFGECRAVWLRTWYNYAHHFHWIAECMHTWHIEKLLASHAYTHTHTKCHEQQTNILIAARSLGRLNCRNFASKLAEVEIPENFSEWPSVERRRGVDTTEIVVTYNSYWIVLLHVENLNFIRDPRMFSTTARARPKGRER